MRKFFRLKIFDSRIFVQKNHIKKYEGRTDRRKNEKSLKVKVYVRPKLKGERKYNNQSA